MSDQLTPERLAELRALCEAYSNAAQKATVSGNRIIPELWQLRVAAGHALPDLLAEIERLQVELLKLADEQKDYIKWAQRSDSEVVRQRYEIGNLKDKLEAARAEIERLTQELAAIKARSCGTCKHRIDEEGSEIYCERMNSDSDWLGDDWNCAYWSPLIVLEMAK